MPDRAGVENGWNQALRTAITPAKSKVPKVASFLSQRSHDSSDWASVFYWLLFAEARRGAPFHWVPPASLHLQPDAPRHRETSQLSAEGRPDVHLHRGPEMRLRGLPDQHHWVYHISLAHKQRTTKGRHTSSSSKIKKKQTLSVRGSISLGDGWFWGSGLWIRQTDSTLSNNVFGSQQSSAITRFCSILVETSPDAALVPDSLQRHTEATHCGIFGSPKWDVIKLRVKLRSFLQL